MAANSPVERFTDLQVWRRSHELFVHTVRDMEDAPRTRTADILIGQIVRSLGSVGANIAEGFNRSKAKFLNSLDISLGEANETENWLYKIRDLDLLPQDTANRHVKECIEIEKMLNGLIASIKRRPDGRKS